MNLDGQNCTEIWLIHTSRSPAKEALDGDTAAGQDGCTVGNWYRIQCPLPDGGGVDGDDRGAATPKLDAVVDKITIRFLGFFLLWKNKNFLTV